MRIYIFLSAFWVILHNSLQVHAVNCTCRTATDDTEWFLLFKPVGQLKAKIISPANAGWASDGANMNTDTGHALAQTLAEWMGPILDDMTALGYSNTPPKSTITSQTTSSKGILMFGNETTDGFWLLHTFERAFPNSVPWSWPSKFTSEGHMALCLSISEDNVPLIVPALQYQEVVIYFGQVSSEKATEFADLTSLIDGSLPEITPPLWKQKTITTINSALSAVVYSKTSSSRLEMYGSFLARVMVVNMRIWAVTDNTLQTTCGGKIGFVKVVKSPVTIDGTQNDRNKDKSQWAVIDDNPVFCFTTNGYSTKQRTVAGSATCITQQVVSTSVTFQRFNQLANCFDATLAWYKFDISFYNIKKFHFVSRFQNIFFITSWFVLFNALFGVLVNESEFTPWKTMKSVGERKRSQQQERQQMQQLNAKLLVKLFLFYKLPKKTIAQIISATTPTWTADKAALTSKQNNSLVETLEGWIEPMSENLSGFGYNNNPPSMTGMSTRSTSKGILMLTNSEAIDEAFYLVYTMDGFLENGVGWVWPQVLTSQGHMGLCMQISESDIASIGNIEVLTPMFWDLQSITTQKTSVPINIYAKMFDSRLEMYSKLLVTRLQANIRIWAKTDGSLTTTCGGRVGFVKVVKSPILVGTQQATRMNDQSQWMIVENQPTFCFTTNKYTRKEMLSAAGAAICLQQFQLSTLFATIAANLHNSSFLLVFNTLIALLKQNLNFMLWMLTALSHRPLMLTAPGYVTAKISNAMNVPWTDDAAPLTSDRGHALALTLDSWLVPLTSNLSALGYSNEPPYLSGIKTQSTVKGIITMSNNGQSAFWFVHTFSRFLANAVAWTWPSALTEEGHMAVCMEVSATTIQSIATSLTYQQPVIYFSNIDVALQPTQVTLMNLINGFSKITSSPFWHLQTITTLSSGMPVPISIYSKLSMARLEFYGRLLTKQLQANLRIWSRTDGTLTSTCGGKIGHVKLVKSPISIDGQQSRREADYAQWVSVENHPLKEQYLFSGAGVCFTQQALSSSFADMAKHVIPCPFS
ncbi:Deoxyribonuclease-2-alpha [Trichinella sp. T8]|nr:Deoxyribonuclease-2-alpha [Trichinella sp. T8]